MRKFHYLLLVLSIILALYELALMLNYRDISLSKLVFILAILLGIYSYLYLMNKMPFFITIIIFMVLISFIWIEGKVAYYSFDHTTTKSYDTIVVLGAQVRNGKPSPALQYRIDKLEEYLSYYPETIVVASGGQGNNEVMSEAKCIQENVKSNQNYHFILEEESTSTYENLQFSSPYFKGKVGVISNSFHLYRVALLAKQLNLDVELIPAHNHSTTYPHFLIREYFGILQYYLTSIF